MSMNQYRRFPGRRERPYRRPPFYGYPYEPYPYYGQPYPYEQPYPYPSYPYPQPYPSQPVPTTPETGACPQGSLPYTVQSGDTLENIASRLGTSPGAITNLNPGVNFSIPLRNGQSICLPVESEEGQE